jgi:hypothetical protein
VSIIKQDRLDSLAERIAVSPIGEGLRKALRKAIKASLLPPTDHAEFVQAWALNCYEYAAALIAEGERRAAEKKTGGPSDEPR